MNTRRKSLIVFGVVTVSLPRLAFAQAKGPPVVVGRLSGGTSAAPGHVAFKEGLAALGWKEALLAAPTRNEPQCA